MIDINKEAEEYLDRTYSLSYEKTTWQKLHIKSFIAGHNSKATQAKVIQAQIELSIHYMNNTNDADTLYFIGKQVTELQQKIKQLKNE
jgi:hypothetical protein